MINNILLILLPPMSEVYGHIVETDMVNLTGKKSGGLEQEIRE